MRKLTVTIGSFLFVLAWALPAGAVTRTVSAQDNFFSPTPIRVAQGVTVQWKNDGGNSHTSTQDDSLDLWDTATILPGNSADVTMASAGTFPYHCIFHGGNGGSGMSGVVKVPVKVTPSSGQVGDAFTVTVSTANADTGFVFDVQKKKDAGAWKSFRLGAKSKDLPFTPSAAGTYSFRSRLHRTSVGVSKYSPPATISVAAA